MLLVIIVSSCSDWDDEPSVKLDDATGEVSYFDDRAPRAWSPRGPFASSPTPATRDQRLVPPHTPFDPQPVLAMWDENVRTDIKCYHCGLLFHWTSEAIAHWSSARHLQMIDFLNGEPMMYCVVCNWLPDMPNLHLLGSRHRKNLRRLSRIAQHADMQVRRVHRFANGRMYAMLLNPYD